MEFIMDPSLVLYLPLYELDGASFRSKDAYGHLCQVTGAQWQLNGMNFDPSNPDYIELPLSASQLDFVSGDFSIITRVKIDDLTAHRQLFIRGQSSVAGYEFFAHNSGVVTFRTYQPAVNQQSYCPIGTPATGVWRTFGISRKGASVRVYRDGVDATSFAGVHVNPISYAPSAKIGIYDDKIARPFDGKISLVAVWNRALSVIEHRKVHDMLKCGHQ